MTFSVQSRMLRKVLQKVTAFFGGTMEVRIRLKYFSLLGFNQECCLKYRRDRQSFLEVWFSVLILKAGNARFANPSYTKV